MTPENFCYWLQGYLEISGNENLIEAQVKIVKDHLDLVLEKKTPTYGGRTRSIYDPDPLDPRIKGILSC